MQPTDISNPDYFHKVVDCQWACPAHTPVPEYIRLIAARRFGDAWAINWESNVFPGILGRTCDRPCEPACRRGRVEKEPVAICRLKRVAADNKGDISRYLPAIPTEKNGKRIALDRRRPGLADRGARSDAAGLSLRHVRRRRQGRRHDAQPDPALPPARIGYRRGGRPDPRHGGRDPLRPLTSTACARLLAEGWDAVFVGSGAPRGREIEIPGRQEAAAHIHIGIDWLSSRLVRPCRQDRPPRRRARRRQHGDGLLPLVAPPRRRGGHRRRALAASRR